MNFWVKVSKRINKIFFPIFQFFDFPEKILKNIQPGSAKSKRIHCHSRYQKNETEEEEKERLAQWEKFLQGEEDTDKAKKEETEEKKEENEEVSTVRKEEKKKKDEKENSDNCKENESPSEDMEIN